MSCVNPGTLRCCDASQNPGDKHFLQWARARSGPEWGCGLLLAPGKDRVPVSCRDGSWEPHGARTDSESAPTDTPRHVRLSSPHAGFTSSHHPCVGLSPGGSRGPEGSGQRSSRPPRAPCPPARPLCPRLRELPCPGRPRTKHPLPAPHMQLWRAGGTPGAGTAIQTLRTFYSAQLLPWRLHWALWKRQGRGGRIKINAHHH